MLPDLNTVLKVRDRKYRSIASHLSDYILTMESDNARLTDNDIYTDLTTSRGSQRLLGFFSQKGIHLAFNNFGIYEILRKKGLKDPVLEIDTSDQYKHRVYVTHKLKDQNYMSIEAVVRRTTLSIPSLITNSIEKRDFILVEWLMLQNELKDFTRNRPQLPGQDHPGLGVSNLIFEILYWTGRRLKVDGILFVPNFLHSALFYGRMMVMLDPARQAELYVFDKMLRSSCKIDQLTWACAEGHLLDSHTNEPYLWKPAPITIPISLRFKDRFHSPAFTKQVEANSKKLSYKITPGYHKKFDHEWKAV